MSSFMKPRESANVSRLKVVEGQEQKEVRHTGSKAKIDELRASP